MGEILQRAIVLLAAIGLTSCSQEETTKKEDLANRPTVPITAGEVKIGDQIWMTKNLNVSRYRNGDVIPQVQDPSQWANLTTGAWCFYANNTGNGVTYGKLYNWHAVNDPRGLAPKGYHIPTQSEFSDLVSVLGGTSVAGGALKEVGTTHWNSPNTGATNSSGFTGLPGGYLFSGVGGLFSGFGAGGLYWSVTENETNTAFGLYTAASFAGATIGNYAMTDGLSVRCVKDETVSDIDSNSYVVVKIGSQKWTQSNLSVTRYRNGDPIPQVQDPVAWSGLTTGAWCYYQNSTSNGIVYGKLYNWYAVTDPRGLAPVGWHIATDPEWTTLVNFLGGDPISGGKLKSKTGWMNPNSGATNSSRFTALPGGVRDDTGFSGNMGYGVNFWSATAYNQSSAWGRMLFSDQIYCDRDYFPRTFGLAVRCIKD